MKIIETTYYRGDIVEIITSKYKSANENQTNPLEFIGQRFRILHVTGDYRGRTMIYRGDFMCSLSVYSDQLMLYKRPVRNWVKRILNITNYTQQYED